MKVDLSRTWLWRKLRERRILRQHARVAAVCEELIARYRTEGAPVELKPKKQFDSERIIWQYWAQGYEDVPPLVRECLSSVEKFAAGYTLVRLTDANLSEYIDLPEFVQNRRHSYARAHFADLLRLMLLRVYGGIWMDATILLSGPLPEPWADAGFFVFRRDPGEPNRRYWRNTYAYYFSWTPGFRVNMLNSFIVARRGNRTVSELCDLLLLWWRDHDALPDYFFFQILFDVYGCREDFPLVSDTLLHYLQQSMNDPAFQLMTREEILTSIPVHKLTYK